MKSRSKRNIPTEVEFEAASRAMASRIREEAEVKKRVVAFAATSPIFHDVWIGLPEGRCHADLFVRSDSHVGSAAGMRLREAVSDLLSRIVGARRAVTVDLDSHERVLREFNGDYFLRMR